MSIAANVKIKAPVIIVVVSKAPDINKPITIAVTNARAIIPIQVPNSPKAVLNWWHEPVLAESIGVLSNSSPK